MKSLLAILVFTFSAAAFAQNDQEGSLYICKEKDVKATQDMRTIVLRKISKGPVREGEAAIYRFTMLKSGSSKPILSTNVTVTTEDVMFNFESTKDKLTGIIFMDEFDQTSVELNGESLRFDCN